MNRPARHVVAVVASLLLVASGVATFVDPDVWHLMALARETLSLGAMPLDDHFAYTPTVWPVVQHEWGTGMILYFLAMHGGTVALQLARCVLYTVILVEALRVARARGATTATLALTAPIAIVMGWIGFTAIRPQVFTLAFLAIWLRCIESDRRGGRRWIALALPGHVLWLNLHAGFVVGWGFLALHAAEQAVRRRPYLHIVGALAAMALLVVVNPYGPKYYGYLAHALSMPRPLIGEWRPIWQAHPAGFAIYLVSVAVALRGLLASGPRSVPGWPILVATAYLAASHERHVSIYALVWLAYVPAMLPTTSLGAILETLWDRPASPATRALALLVVVLPGVLVAKNRPWHLTVPGTTADGAPAPYPVGPVDYLERHAVAGNVLVPFGVGAYVSWKLHPRIKVSLDSRYEVAYPPELLAEHLRFFAARPGWRDTLDRYPTDLVLAPTTAPVVEKMTTETSWTVAYRDDAYMLLARPGLALAPLDRRGERLVGTFP
jgi:hypothetical protein